MIDPENRHQIEDLMSSLRDAAEQMTEEDNFGPLWAHVVNNVPDLTDEQRQGILAPAMGTLDDGTPSVKLPMRIMFATQSIPRVVDTSLGPVLLMGSVDVDGGTFIGASLFHVMLALSKDLKGTIDSKEKAENIFGMINKKG